MFTSARSGWWGEGGTPARSEWWGEFTPARSEWSGGGNPSQVWMVGGGTWGTPQPGLDGVPPPPSIASTCYAAGGMPLASTQEDFLVYCCYHMKMKKFRRTSPVPSINSPMHGCDINDVMNYLKRLTFL